MTGSVRGALSNERPYRDRALTPVHAVCATFTARAVPTRFGMGLYLRVGTARRARLCPPYRSPQAGDACVAPGSVALSRFWASDRMRARCSLQRASGIAANTISIGSIGNRYFGLATGPLSSRK
jgi:hypothetical protein